VTKAGNQFGYSIIWKLDGKAKTECLSKPMSSREEPTFVYNEWEGNGKRKVEKISRRT